MHKYWCSALSALRVRSKRVLRWRITLLFWKWLEIIRESFGNSLLVDPLPMFRHLAIYVQLICLFLSLRETPRNIQSHCNNNVRLLIRWSLVPCGFQASRKTFGVQFWTCSLWTHDLLPSCLGCSGTDVGFLNSLVLLLCFHVSSIQVLHGPRLSYEYIRT